MKNSTNEKKQIVLRLSSSLWRELAQWSSEEFRSINGQIEYILTEAVKKRKKLEQDSLEADHDD